MASLVPDAPDLNSNSSDSDQGQKRESVEKKEREKKRKREESTTSSSRSSSSGSSSTDRSSEEEKRPRREKEAKENKDDLRRGSGNSSDRRQRQESEEQRSQRSVNGRDGQRSKTPMREETQGSVGPFTLRSIIDSRSVANGNGESLDDDFLSHKEYLLKKNELRNQLDERTEKLRISRNETAYYKRMMELAEEEAKESKLKLEPFEQKIAIYEQRLAQAQDDIEELEEQMKKRQVDHSRQLEEEKQKSLDALETMKRESSELERKLQRANEKIDNLEKCVIDSDQQLLERTGELAEATENLEHMRKRAEKNEKCLMEFQKLKNAYTHQKQKNMRLENILKETASESEQRVPVEPMVSHRQNEHSRIDNDNQESFNSSHSSGLDHHRSQHPTMPQSVTPRNGQSGDHVPIREPVALPLKLKSCLKNSSNGLQSGDQSRDHSDVSTRRLSEKAYTEAIQNREIAPFTCQNRDPSGESRDRHLQNGGRAPLFQPYVMTSSASLHPPSLQHLSDRRLASPSSHTLSPAAQNVSRRPANDVLLNQSTSSERSSAHSISSAQAPSGGRVPIQSNALSSLSSSRVSHTPSSLPLSLPSIPRFPDTGIIDPYAIVPQADEVPVGELNKFKIPVVQGVVYIEDDD